MNASEILCDLYYPENRIMRTLLYEADCSFNIEPEAGIDAFPCTLVSAELNGYACRINSDECMGNNETTSIKES